MTHDDIFNQIPDYVLDLISPSQRTIIERHAADCPACRQAIRGERKLSQLVRLTVDAATKPDAAHIRSLMPSGLQKRRSGLILDGWQKQFAPALLILLLFFGGIMLNRMLPAGSVPSLIATAHAATATSTNTPTATLALSTPEKNGVNHLSKLSHFNVSELPVPAPSPKKDRAMETPDPHPTPVVPFKQITTN